MGIPHNLLQPPTCTGPRPPRATTPSCSLEQSVSSLAICFNGVQRQNSRAHMGHSTFTLPLHKAGGWKFDERSRFARFFWRRHWPEFRVVLLYFACVLEITFVLCPWKGPKFPLYILYSQALHALSYDSQHILIRAGKFHTPRARPELSCFWLGPRRLHPCSWLVAGNWSH